MDLDRAARIWRVFIVVPLLLVYSGFTWSATGTVPVALMAVATIVLLSGALGMSIVRMLFPPDELDELATPGTARR